MVAPHSEEICHKVCDILGDGMDMFSELPEVSSDNVQAGVPSVTQNNFVHPAASNCGIGSEVLLVNIIPLVNCKVTTYEPALNQAPALFS